MQDDKRRKSKPRNTTTSQHLSYATTKKITQLCKRVSNKYVSSYSYIQQESFQECVSIIANKITIKVLNFVHDKTPSSKAPSFLTKPEFGVLNYFKSKSYHINNAY